MALLHGFVLAGWLSYCQSPALPPALSHSLPVVLADGRSDLWTSLSQPAALAGHKSWQAGILGEQRFGLAELADYLAGVIVPAGNGSFSLQWRKQGKTLFSWQQVGIAYGRSLGKVITIGAGLRYSALRIKEYGKAGAADAMLGLVIRLSEKVNSQAFASYVRQGSNEMALLQSVYRIGMSYKVTGEAAVGCMMQAVNGMRPDLLTAIDYCINNELKLRCSLSVLRGSWGLSVAWSRGAYRVDVFSSHHSRLGLSPGAAVVYQGKSKITE